MVLNFPPVIFYSDVIIFSTLFAADNLWRDEEQSTHYQNNTLIHATWKTRGNHISQIIQGEPMEQ